MTEFQGWFIIACLASMETNYLYQHGDYKRARINSIIGISAVSLGVFTVIINTLINI